MARQSGIFRALIEDILDTEERLRALDSEHELLDKLTISEVDGEYEIKTTTSFCERFRPQDGSDEDALVEYLAALEDALEEEGELTETEKTAEMADVEA